MVGVVKAKRYRAGKITLSDLIGQSGRPQSLEAIKTVAVHYLKQQIL